MTLPDQLGTGQAQVLAAIIRRAGCGPVTLRQLRDDTGLALTTVHRHVRALDAEGLVSYVTGKAGTLRPMVAIGTPEQARLSRQREYDDERRAALRQQDDPSSTSDPRYQESNGQ